MSTHVSIEHTPEGRTLACKRATSPDAVDAVRAEAGRLDELDHPGVVRFVELREDDDGPRLITEYVGPRTLATVGPVTAERAAALVADLATTIADLHTLGVVHGAVLPEHVLVAGEHTVLCGLAPSTEGLGPADDVLGVGHCLHALLDRDLDEEPIPDRRPWRRTPWLGYRHRGLLTLADQATDDDPGRRPSARALADAVREAGGGRPDDAPDRDRRTVGVLAGEVVDLVAVRLRRHPTREPRGPGRRVALLAAVGIVIAAGGALGATTGGAPPPSTLALVEAPTCPVPDGPPAADLDGDGCPESYRLGPGWIEVGEQRFRVGRPGNAVAVGDWDGDGQASVALLQRGTGRVWRFPSWDPDGAVTAEPAGSFAGAIALTAQPATDHDRLVVRLRNGASTEVPA